MFNSWVKRLDTMQFPATAFPAAGGDPAVETEESHQLDGAVVAAAIASLWVLLMSARSGSGNFIGLDRAVITYGPLFLVAVFGALVLRPQTSIKSIPVYVAGYVGIAALMGLGWVALGSHSVFGVPALDVVAWGALFAVVGFITGVLSVVAWATTLRLLDTPRTPLYDHASAFRLMAAALILFAALLSAKRALPTVGF
ncbi:MAG: hypothetical protein ABI744_03795 [Chloroflexota bacterium]